MRKERLTVAFIEVIMKSRLTNYLDTAPMGLIKVLARELAEQLIEIQDANGIIPNDNIEFHADGVKFK